MHSTAVIPLPSLVTILMGVWNGAAHLPAQLESIARQTHRNWHLVCSDDGSTDNSIEILQEFAALHPGQVTLTTGPGRGYSANYISLIGTYGDKGHISLADQDDIWAPDKTARALAQMRDNQAEPELYCGRRSYWYPQKDRVTQSRPMHRPFTLRNALVENIASGNTIVLNPPAARLAKQAALRGPEVFAHDWWLYLLITATGGTVTFDNGTPLVLYRQHDRNAIGAGTGPRTQIRRKTEVLKGAFSQRVETNLKALSDINDLLAPEARDLLAAFAVARKHGLARRLAGLRYVSPYRQRRWDSFGFWGAASLGKV